MAELGEISKSQIGAAGKYIPITQMTGKQLKQLRAKNIALKAQREHGKARAFGESRLTTKQKAFWGQQQQVANTVHANMQPGKQVTPIGGIMDRPTPGAVKRVQGALKRMNVRRRVVVNAPIPAGSNMQAAAGPLRRDTGMVLTQEFNKPAKAVATHEAAHISPKRRTAFRMWQINQSPKKLAREEARADAMARKHHPKHKFLSGYEEQARLVDMSDAVRRARQGGGRLKGESTRLAAFNSAMGGPKQGLGATFTPAQARSYRGIRRKTGTWSEKGHGEVMHNVRNVAAQRGLESPI